LNELNVKRVFLSEDVFLSDTLIVTNLENAYKYLEGQKTSEVDGKWVEVVDTTKFDKFRIKMPADFDIELRSQIEVVDLINFRAKLYVRNNRIYWSMKSDGIN